MRVKRKSDQEFYEEKSWGSAPIKMAKDLPTIKLRYLLDVIRKRKKRHATLLEVGCGSGRILASIREHDKDLVLTGVDISKEQVRLAKRDNAGKDITFVHANSERLPFPTGSFDFVVFMDVMEHVDNPEHFMDEVARVLKRGGTLAGFCPAEAHGIYWLSKKIFGRHILDKTCGHIQQFTIDDVARLVQRPGLRITNKRYSYHLLGGTMNYTVFVALYNKRLARLFWQKNKYYQKGQSKKTIASRVLNSLLSFGNAIAYYESTLLKNKRFTATGLHFVARK